MASRETITNDQANFTWDYLAKPSEKLATLKDVGISDSSLIDLKWKKIPKGMRGKIMSIESFEQLIMKHKELPSYSKRYQALASLKKKFAKASGTSDGAIKAWRTRRGANPALDEAEDIYDKMINADGIEETRKNIVDLEIKHYGGSYPDVLEYKQDGIVDVKTYEWLTGYDKNTGLDLNMPRYATYRMNEKGDKIAGLWINDDEILWQKNWDAYETNENGVIYKDHPLVSKVRLLYQSYKTGDVEKIKANYTENTIFYDVMNSGIDEFKTLEEEFAQFDQYMEIFELV